MSFPLSNFDQGGTLLSEIFSEITDATLIVTDLNDGRMRYISSAFSKNFGYPTEAFIGSNISKFIDLIHPEDQNLIIQSAEQIQRTKENIHSPANHRILLRFRLKRSSGQYGWVESITHYLQYGPTGHPQLSLGLVWDVETLFGKTDFIEEDSKIQSFLGKGSFQPISNRELEVLKLIAAGQTARAIASQLSISEHTVITHRKNLLAKFRAKNIAELIRNAMRSYWLE
ncbi:LuxR C-terminal-related transcriptional regulator [Pontibacter sp. G13]|uniref:LuxR C-terminal-related transcriptional regulator n=1 Tax=Pontibacter sp. G13 TaxID=3074898 RepID=UPI00288C01A1|nr:LuxR C-terminal-related transcriptional regulator [Pontibacter sp. G13]WNJ16792.1 LuxR C-terminal-related transcriptional regulator [Pontibacter sp. G13]